MSEHPIVERESSGHLTPLSGIQQGLELVSDKWTVQVIYALQPGTRRLSDLQRSIKGVSQKMLIQTLRELERHGLVKRKVYPVVPPKVEYSLTPLGETVIEPLYALYEWTNTHFEKMQEARQQYREEIGN